MQGNGQLDRPQIARQMTAVFRDDGEDRPPDFVSEFGKRGFRHTLEVVR